MGWGSGPGYARRVADRRSAAHLAKPVGRAALSSSPGAGEQLALDGGDPGEVSRPGARGGGATLGSPAGAAAPVLLVTAQLVLSYLHLLAPAAIVTAAGNLKATFQGPLFHRLIYSDLYTEYYIHNLFRPRVPYVHKAIEYPVLTGLYMWLAAALTHGVREYFLVSSIGLWICTAGSVLVLWSWSHRAAWLLSVCPLVFVYALLNWDIFAIFLMLLGWRQYRRGRYGSAGAWLAAGTFAKLYPAFLLVFVLVELARRSRDGDGTVTRQAVVKFVGWAAAVSLVINVPFMVLNFANWSLFFGFNADRSEQDGLLFWLRLLNHLSTRAAAVVLVVVVVAFVAVGVVAVWRGAEVCRVTAMVFAGFLLVQKVYSPQYTLWLFVFALLAEWQVWTLVLLTAGGLYDYINSVVILDLTASHSPAFQWYYERVFPLGRAARLCAIGISAAGAFAVSRRRTSQPDGVSRPAGSARPEIRSP